MDTNLKKSKMVRAFICKVFAVGALIAAIGTGIMGREAVVEFAKHGPQVLSGKLYDFPEFREYISELYSNAMIGYAGAGDDNGYPLTDKRASNYTSEVKGLYTTQIIQLDEDIVYFMRKTDSRGIHYVDSGNMKYPILSEYDGHLIIPEDMLVCCYWNGEEENLTFFGKTYGEVYSNKPYQKYYDSQYQPNKDEAKRIKYILLVKKECSSELLSNMEVAAVKYRYVLISLFAFIGIWLGCSIYGLWARKAGKAGKEGFAKVSARVFVEMKLILLALSIFVAWYYDLLAVEYDYAYRAMAFGFLWLYIPIGCIWYLLCVDIKRNRHNILRKSIPGLVIRNIAEVIGQKPWCRRALWYNIGFTAGGVITLVTGIVMVVMSLQYKPMYYYRYSDWAVPTIILGTLLILTGCILLVCRPKQKKLVKDMAAIADKLEEVKNGHMGEPLKLSQKSLLAATAENLNDLEKGIERAVEEQNRSNRMRVELITNVSHDLKTPLTSIINYADLLCEEELPEASAEYAKALRAKAYRLKNMVQDVFDLSKATSGNLNVEAVTIDLVKLIRQTLADMDERIQESNLTFKLNIATEPLLIEADGEKLYRVFQNLFVNALQYSLDHSRVHIQLKEEDGFAVAVVKNTSRMELDFDTTEIVERFVRADSSRTTEGSGLGLSIVQSFVEACDGDFKVETDADMFTARVRFPLSGKQIIEGEKIENE